MIYPAIRKIEKGKVCVHIWQKKNYDYGVNICSVNLDRETTFLTLS